MSVACAMLGRSMVDGRNSATIQYETTRKKRSRYSNFAQTCPDGLGSVFIRKDGSGSVVTFSKTNSEIFSRFDSQRERIVVWEITFIFAGEVQTKYPNLIGDDEKRK